MLDPNTIRYEATIEDPNVFARPWKIRVVLSRRTGIDRIREFHCQAEKEERNGDFEREARTWYPGPKAALKTFAFNPPPEQHRPSTAPASVRRTADGRPDLNGVYEPDHGGANWGIEAHPQEVLTPGGRGIVIDPPDGKLPFQPWAREERAARNSSLRGYDDPTAHCFPAGVPRALYVPVPFQIVQTAETVATLHERMAWRVIALNRSRHLPGTVRFWQGDSIGHWDGDTLAVETTNLNGKTWGSEAGDVFSYAEHVLERFTPVDTNTIQYEATITDPLVYTRPFTIAFPIRRMAWGELMEAACHEEDRDLADTQADTGSGTQAARYTPAQSLIPNPQSLSRTKLFYAWEMDFDLNAHQQDVQRRARDFAETVVAPAAAELDRQGRCPAEIIAGVAGLGLLGCEHDFVAYTAGLDRDLQGLGLARIHHRCSQLAGLLSHCALRHRRAEEEISLAAHRSEAARLLRVCRAICRI